MIASGNEPDAGFVADDNVDIVSVPSSASTGKWIVGTAYAMLKRVHSKLSGKAPAISAFDGPDSDAIGQMIADNGLYGDVLPGSIAATHVLLRSPVHDDVGPRLADYAKTHRLGNKLDPGKRFGR